jgi:dephospho-CoA kinase
MQNKHVQFIGITGGIGSGKSTVTRYLRELGYPVIDADALARRAVEPGSPALKAVAETFGDEMLFEDGSLNRKKLGAMVFSDPEKLDLLNRIVHPEVERLLLAAYKAFSETHAVVFADVPLLYETGQEARYDAIWVVYAPRMVCVERIMSRDGATRDYAERQIEAQMSLEEKRERADVVLVNDDTPEKLYAQVENALEKQL